MRLAPLILTSIQYCLVLDPQLHFNWQFRHGDYDPSQLVTLNRPSTINDVADFVVNYIKVMILRNATIHSQYHRTTSSE